MRKGIIKIKGRWKGRGIVTLKYRVVKRLKGKSGWKMLEEVQL